jgi:penicillin G amidase
VNTLDDVIKGIKGSNSWVIHGNHTASGKPILANDPHLETMIPSMWYQAEFVWNHNNKLKQAMGATLPGLPFIMIGRTDYFAWGITNNIIDISDYYVETIKDSEYLFNDKWLPLKEINETINVRNYSFFSFVYCSQLIPNYRLLIDSI